MIKTILFGKETTEHKSWFPTNNHSFPPGFIRPGDKVEVIENPPNFPQCKGEFGTIQYVTGESAGIEFKNGIHRFIAIKHLGLVIE